MLGHCSVRSLYLGYSEHFRSDMTVLALLDPVSEHLHHLHSFLRVFKETGVPITDGLKRKKQTKKTVKRSAIKCLRLHFYKWYDSRLPKVSLPPHAKIFLPVSSATSSVSKLSWPFILNSRYAKHRISRLCGVKNTKSCESLC